MILAALLGGWLDPMHGEGYAFWSGIGSDVFLLAPVLLLWHHLNCHEQGCWRLGHPHPDTAHLPVCRRHHPELQPKPLPEFPEFQ